MSTKTYRIIKLIIAMLLSMTIAISVNLNNYILPPILAIVAMIILILIKRKVTDVLADERDYNMAGTAARWTITIFSIAMMIGFFVLFSIQDKDPEMITTIAFLLAYLTCGLMLLNSVIFSFLKYKESDDKKNLGHRIKHYFPIIILTMILGFFIALFIFRAFTPEDTWLCDDGAWVRHGNPDSDKPTELCQ